MGELWLVLGIWTRQGYLLGVPPTFAFSSRLSGLEVAQIKIANSFQAGN